VRPTTGNPCTYGTIAYSYRSVYSTVRALVWQNERETEEREGTTPSNVLKSDTLKNHRDHKLLYVFHLSLSLSPLSFSPFYYLYLPNDTSRKRSFPFFVNLGRNWRAIVEIISPSTFISADAERKWVTNAWHWYPYAWKENELRRDVTPGCFPSGKADPPHSLVHKTLDRDHCVRGSCMRTRMILANRISSRDK